MGAALRRFIARAPRYILRPQDRNMMRYSLQDTVGPAGIEQTWLINLSETGVAFLTNTTTRLEVGERIKVEIPVPSGDQLAWWARVVRVQEYEPRSWFTNKKSFDEHPRLLVALRFEELPEAHGKALRRGIEDSFLKAVRDQRYKTWFYYKVYFLKMAPQILLYGLLTALAFGLIYWLSLPDKDYDAKRGAPWGQRFKF